MDNTDNNLEIVNDNMDFLLGSLGDMSQSSLSTGSFGPTALSDGIGAFGAHGLLSQKRYEALYDKVRIFQNMVNLIPEDANLDYPSVLTGEEMNDGAPEIVEFFKQIPSMGEPMEEINLKQAITLAGVYGRLFGDGFIILGIDDGQPMSEPVNWETVKGLNWISVKHRYEVSMDYFNECIVYTRSRYTRKELESGEQNALSKYHISRVFRFSGVERHGDSYLNSGFNCSIIDGVYDDYMRYLKAIKAGADMLQTHSTFKFGIQGLDAKSHKKDILIALSKRIRNIMQSIRQVGGIMYDKHSEEAEYIDRKYSGVKDIMEHLKDWLVGNSGMPRNKVFGSAASNSLSEQSEGEKAQWNEIIARYRSTDVVPFYEYLIRIYKAASKDEDNYSVYFEDFYPESQIDLALLHEKQEQTIDLRVNRVLLLLERGLLTDEEAKQEIENILR